MKQLLIAIATLMLLTGNALSQENDYYSTVQHEIYQQKSDIPCFTQPYTQDAYGHGVHSDATAQPFEWKTQDGDIKYSDKIKPDGYGLDVGMDECGRSVYPERHK